MSICVKFLRAFWMATLLVMTGTQIAHATTGVLAPSLEIPAAHTSHSDHDHSDSEHGDCPANHCCHLHSFASLFRVEPHDFRSPLVAGEKLSSFEQPLPDSPVREIDHPPQLS